ncbi:MAG: radical SAM family heme chaperone HemW [Bacteroidota bacterium]
MNSSLYLHIPFCEHKCIYCDFYSVAPNGGGSADYRALIDRFLSALEKEIAFRGSDPQFQASYETVFLGGGTPSLLEASNIERILGLLADRFSLVDGAEITLETNPGTVDRAKLEAFRKAGVNRLSVGIQSFHEDDLRFLTRIHSADQAMDCIRNAYAAGFENVSLDLIFALPGQTMDRWRVNLETAMKLQPTHISCYSLIVEENTPLHRMVAAKQVTPLAQERDAELYEFTIGFLESHGYEQYEVSNFCKPGFHSRHNSRYWDHGNYLGFGPSAHSFWNGTRWWNLSNVTKYAQLMEQGTIPVGGKEILTGDQRKDEEVFLGLRSSGIDLGGFKERHGSDLEQDFREVIHRLLDTRLATSDGKTLRLTARGYALCDEICTEFMK